MMVHIPKVLAPDQVARCRAVMERAAWVDGRVTAGHQSAQVKHNLQLPETAPEARELGDMVMQALGRNALFVSAVLPKQVFPPLFNRYDAGMTFGAHVDNAIRGYLDTPAAGPHRRLGDAVHLGAGGLRRRRAGGRGHLRQACGEAAGRRHDRLSRHQPAQRHADHARLAHRLVLLDAEPDPRRCQRGRCCSTSTWRSGGFPRTVPSIRAWCRSPRSTTTCCASGRRCEGEPPDCRPRGSGDLYSRVRSLLVAACAGRRR